MNIRGTTNGTAIERDRFEALDSIITKGSFGLRTRCLKRNLHIFSRFDDPHTPSATAGGRLDYDRVPNVTGDPFGFFILGDCAVRAGNHRDS